MKISELVKAMKNNNEILIYCWYNAWECDMGAEPDDCGKERYGEYGPTCDGCDYLNIKTRTLCLFEGKVDDVPIKLSDKKIEDIEIHKVKIKYKKLTKRQIKYYPEYKSVIAIRVEE